MTLHPFFSSRWLARLGQIVGALGLGLALFGLLLWLPPASQAAPTQALSPGVAAPPLAAAEPLAVGDAPKLTFSTKAVTPTVAAPGISTTLTYTIRLLNTGALTAASASLRDVVPTGTVYLSGSLQASGGTAVYTNGVINWTGVVSFDSSIWLTYNAQVLATFSGTQVVNTAVISDAKIARPVTVTAATILTHVPILTITKASAPLKPGPNKPLIYTLTVRNDGQAATNLPLTVTDWVPVSTTVITAGVDGVTNGNIVTWTRNVTLPLGASTEFTFSVLVGNVTSGTVITNATYQVQSPLTGVVTSTGQPYTVTVIRPIFRLSKYLWPDPPGANSEVTYRLTVLNLGSLATNVVITDQVPTNATYLTGGVYLNGVVSWTLATLDTNESAEVTYTVAISDIAYVPLANNFYRVCSAEGTCRAGTPISTPIGGPTFEVQVTLDPIAKKPGGGGGPVTPTLVVRNLGPGHAIDAVAVLYFDNIAVSANDLYVTPTIGTPPPFPSGPACGSGGSNCRSYVWTGSLAVGEVATFTTIVGQSTIGGAEGNRYTATLVITDSLSGLVSPPFTGTANGLVTHMASYVVTKDAPTVIGRGEIFTYHLNIRNGALAGEDPFILTDVVPLSTTVVSISGGGVTQVISSGVMISWTLPALGTGEVTQRSFSVRVSNAAVSGTQLVNKAYGVAWVESESATNPLIFLGEAVTTTVQDEGLIASFKLVTPTWALPGRGIVLTYELNVVNSSELSLTNVSLTDTLPWAMTTYQRDAVTSTGAVVSNIVSLNWTGDVGPLATELITFTVVVDPYYEGPVTNTAVITHPSLVAPLQLQAIAYITDDPVLFINKVASPDPVAYGGELEYTIHVVNAGQQATALVITDLLPINTVYVTGSVTANGQVLSNTVTWNLAVLENAQDFSFKYRVRVYDLLLVRNERYGVRSAEGVKVMGQPVLTPVYINNRLFLPLIRR